jgi:hypothetical protein
MAGLARGQRARGVLAAAIAVGAACTERVELPAAGSGRPMRDGGCQEFLEPLDFRVQTPEALIVFDRSFSMTRQYGSSTRIQVARQALLAAIRMYDGAIQFGYQEFPGRGGCDPPGCCASRVLVAPQLNGYAALESQLRCDPADRTCFDTPAESPSADAIRRARLFFDQDVDSRTERHVLLLTDGDPSCSVDGCDSLVRETSRLWGDHAARTAVVTLGEDIRTSSCLDMVAAAGQTARPGSPAYSWAADEVQFRQHVQDAVASMTTRTCRATLRSVPPSFEKVSVKFDDVTVPRDPSRREGWSFDPPSSLTIRLHGTWCEKLRDSPAPGRDLEVFMACTQCGSTTTCE